MPFECIPGFSFSREEVAIAISHGAFGSHIGIAFHSAKDGPQLVHLRFHKDLKVEPFPPVMECWIVCLAKLPISASKPLVGIVRSIAKRLPQINFGINFLAARGSFDRSGAYKPPRGSDGLTCATFICEVFRAAGLALVREETWLPEPENVRWGEEVCDLLRKKGATEDHVAAVRANNAGLRVRPEEVGAAAATPVMFRPIDFSTAKAGVPAVVAMLADCCPKTRLLLSPRPLLPFTPLLPSPGL